MKLFLKMLILPIAVVGIVSVSYLNADHNNNKGGSWDPNTGTGFAYEYGENDVHTGYVSTSVMVYDGRTKWRIPYSAVYVSAYFSTKKLDSMGNSNWGKRRVWTDKTGKEDWKDYWEDESDTRSTTKKYYWRSPHKCGGMTLAGVAPTNDNTIIVKSSKPLGLGK